MKDELDKLQMVNFQVVKNHHQLTADFKEKVIEIDDLRFAHEAEKRSLESKLAELKDALKQEADLLR